jgi:hypothetical protein
LNDNDIASLGGFCLELLRDQRFQALIQLFDQQCAADILGTKTDAKEQRERIYHEHNGLAVFIDLMEKFAETFDKLTAPPPDQSEPQDDPTVHNIYDYEEN